MDHITLATDKASEIMADTTASNEHGASLREHNEDLMIFYIKILRTRPQASATEESITIDTTVQI